MTTSPFVVLGFGAFTCGLHPPFKDKDHSLCRAGNAGGPLLNSTTTQVSTVPPRECPAVALLCSRIFSQRLESCCLEYRGEMLVVLDALVNVHRMTRDTRTSTTFPNRVGPEIGLIPFQKRPYTNASRSMYALNT